MSGRTGFLLRMGRKWKILILLGVALLLALCTAFAVVLYYMESPGELKALVEQSISQATGAECSISEFSYSLNPLFVHARGIQLIDHVAVVLPGNSRIGYGTFSCKAPLLEEALW